MLEAQDLDPLRDKQLLLDVRAAIAQALDTMRAADSVLRRSPETELRLPSEFASDAEERALRHNRMQTLLQLLDELPSGCHESTRALRRQLHRELHANDRAHVLGR